MKRLYVAIAALVLGIGILATAGLRQAVADEKVTIDQVPQAVRVTINAHAGGAAIEKIEKEEEGGRVIYTVEQTVNGKAVEFEVSEAGEYLGAEGEEAEDDDDAEDEDAEDDDGEEEDGEDEDDEEAVAWGQLPKAVQDGLNAAISGGTPTALTRETDEGFVAYEAEYTINGAGFTVKISEDGSVLETEEEVSALNLPAGVAATLKRLAPNGEVVEAELVTVTFYEIAVSQDGHSREIQLLANGYAPEDDEEEEDDDDEDDEDDEEDEDEEDDEDDE